MGKILKHFTNAPVAAALAILLIGAPSAPVPKFLPSSGPALAFGGCGDTIHGCGSRLDGTPCGTPDGVTCIFNYSYSLYDINNMGDLIAVRVAALNTRGVKVAFENQEGADCSATADGLVFGGTIAMGLGGVIGMRPQPPLNITVTDPMDLAYYDPAGVGIVPLSPHNSDEGAGAKSVLDAIGFGLVVAGLITTVTGVTLHYTCGDGNSEDDDDDDDEEES